VRIDVLDYQSRKASVLGEVNTQGLVVLDRDYSVAEILAKAGGLANDAGDSAVIIRQKPGGGSERITIDIGELMATGGAGALTRVEAGDVVFVPKAPNFSVIGAVARAGTYPLRKGMNVDQGLAAAGDVNVYGSRSKVKIRRVPASGGAITTITARLEDLLQPGDIIVVGERVF
jgi:polysaccharide export outer membrane protein